MRCTNLPPLRPFSRRFAAMLAAGALLATLSQTPVAAEESVHESEEHDFRLVRIAEGLEHPWALAFLPDGGILVTERPGRLRLVENGALRDDPIEGLPEISAGGQGGLLDLALHPDFEENQLLYLTYAKAGSEGRTTALARGRFDGERLHDVEDIFVADAWDNGGRHFGSRVIFDNDGYLFLTVGDRGLQDPAQDLSNHIGTTIRLHDDGSVPEDNPFLDDPDVLPEIYSYGHRNAQGMTLHPETGQVWQNEHGPRGGDEINLVEAGLNYGWPVITHGVAYSGEPIGVGGEKEGMEQPLVDWTPSIAPSGMTFYSGDAFPQWRGDAFNGALAHEHLRRVVFDGVEPVHEEEILGELGWRIRAVEQGPDDFLYILSDHSNGALARLEPLDE